MKYMKCVLSSPEKTLVYDRLTEVSLPAAAGRICILPGHAESFIKLKAGSARLKFIDGRKKELTFAREALCHIHGEEIIVIF